MSLLRISETSIESFIIRVYRHHNRYVCCMYIHAYFHLCHSMLQSRLVIMYVEMIIISNETLSMRQMHIIDN